MAKKNAEMKAEGRTYQAQLEADYQAYVKNVTAQNKKHTNWTPVEPMPKSDWLRYGRPQHN